MFQTNHQRSLSVRTVFCYRNKGIITVVTELVLSFNKIHTQESEKLLTQMCIRPKKKDKSISFKEDMKENMTLTSNMCILFYLGNQL